jgi:hypothetical protein
MVKALHHWIDYSLIFIAGRLILTCLLVNFSLFYKITL